MQGHEAFSWLVSILGIDKPARLRLQHFRELCFNTLKADNSGNILTILKVRVVFLLRNSIVRDGILGDGLLGDGLLRDGLRGKKIARIQLILILIPSVM